MKIAYILPSLINKGPIIVVQNLVNELYKRKYDVEVYYFDDKFGVQFDCPTIKLNPQKPPKNFDKYDIIHSHGYRPDKFLFKIKKQLSKAKIVSTIHSHLEKDLAYSYNKIVSVVFATLWKKHLMRFDCVITISHFLEKIYCKRIVNLTTVHNGISVCPNISEADVDIVFQIKQLKKGIVDKIIGAYASITPIKGLHQVLNILPEKKDWAMVIIGEGKEKNNLEKIVHKNGIKDRVLFLPYIQKPYNYLSLFDVYAMTSYSEGFGLALIEAAEAKIPIVCSDIPVFRELFNEDEVAFFTLDNKKSLSDAIENSCDDKSSTEKAYKKNHINYSTTAMVDGYLRVYEKLIDKK